MLVNQKILQDQMANDLTHFDKAKGCAALIKSAVEYACPAHKLCSHGALRGCSARKDGSCPYRMAKRACLSAPLAITNYAYFFSERSFVGEITPRRILCLDESHNLAKLIIGFIDLKISQSKLEDYADADFAADLPKIDTMEKFIPWLKEKYLPAVKDHAEAIAATADMGDIKLTKEAYEVKQHYQKICAGTERLLLSTHDWIFWQQKERTGIELIARPLEAAPYFPELVQEAGALRVYLSAYPGDRATFCRELGLSPQNVAWISLDSTFPVENRPVYLATVGSLGRACKEQNLPGALRMVRRLLDRHTGVRGIIHSHSYEFAETVVRSLEGTPHAQRLIFPKKAEDREAALAMHKLRTDSVLISPSMAEGLDLKDDLARFQIILKCPFASLGDKQVAAKMERNRRWYEGEAVKTILQACGRAVRNESDSAKTYILDSDAEKLLNKWDKDLPKWFTKALVRFS